MAKMSLPKSIGDTVQVMHTPDMEKNNLRLLKLHNADGNVEYHIHNTTLPFGGKSDNVNPRGFLDTLALMHSDAKKELESGRKIVLQTLPDDENFHKFKIFAHRLSLRHGRTVKDIGMTPITSFPAIKGPTLVIE